MFILGKKKKKDPCPLFTGQSGPFIGLVNGYIKNIFLFNNLIHIK